MKIMLEPTGAHEIFNGQPFRVFKGRTDSGIEVQMLGMFRVTGGEIARQTFMQQLADAVGGDGKHPTHALDGHKLIEG
jgi:hypothetical protein